MFPTIDADLVKAISSAGAAALMFLIVVMLLWAGSRCLSSLREITGDFSKALAEQRELCAKETYALTERLFGVVKSFQDQVSQITSDNRSATQSLASTVESLRATVENRMGTPKRGGG